MSVEMESRVSGPCHITSVPHLVRTKLLKAKREVTLIISLVVPLSLLYLCDPFSFVNAWKGRMPYFIFLLLLTFELITSMRKPSDHESGTEKKRSLATLAILALPSAYILLLPLGLMDGVVEMGRIVGVPSGNIYGQGFLENNWPLSVEYVVFTAFLLIVALFLYGEDGPRRFTVSLFFLGAIGFFYTLDTFYPFASFQAFQELVPVVARSTVFLLNSTGYVAKTVPSSLEGAWAVLVCGETSKRFAVTINWPCAGFHSLIIYSAMIVLFLKKMTTRFWHKLTFSVLGAIGTFVVNILRIVSIIRAGIDRGYPAADMFHAYYGEIYFLVWLCFILLSIVLIETKIVPQRKHGPLRRLGP